MSSPRATGGLAGFGDSLTEAIASSLDSNNRWPDQLARRWWRAAGRRVSA